MLRCCCAPAELQSELEITALFEAAAPRHRWQQIAQFGPPSSHPEGRRDSSPISATLVCCSAALQPPHAGASASGKTNWLKSSGHQPSCCSACCSVWQPLGGTGICILCPGRQWRDRERKGDDGERVSTLIAECRHRSRPGRPTDVTFRKTDFLVLRRAV